ncbi:hypothetical protein HDV00_012407 [Rhizophlyctis rosea]|nr:hypothetical protein HDV00_012407 [Rhizophlyctis rosea]
MTRFPYFYFSCPSSFNPSVDRLGSTTGPCEPASSNGRPVTQVTAGDRLKVGWVSGNQGGGYVRLALVAEADAGDAVNFDRNVLKTTCFGYDQREGRFAFGTCVHPCDGRPGCLWQSAESDDERYDTTITVPYNLADGRYVLQMVALPGNSPSPVYSCSLLSVTGGTPDLNCPAPSNIPEATDCLKAAGPSLDVITTNVNAEAGAYCYASDGPSSIDAAIADRPINAACDPRVSCDLSVNRDICRQDLSDIDNPLQPSQTCAHSTVQASFTAPATATSSPPACISNGVISDEAAFCTDFEYNCDTTCTGEGFLPVTTNRCTPNGLLPFGVDISCQCDNQDLTNAVLNALIPGACVATQSVSETVTGTPTATNLAELESESESEATPTTTTRKHHHHHHHHHHTKCHRTKTRKTRTRTRHTRTRTRKTRTRTHHTRTSRTRTSATPTPTCAPVIPDGTACDVKTDRPMCSGRQWVQCIANVSTTSTTGFTSTWQNRNCSEGTACIPLTRGFTCDFEAKSPCPLDLTATRRLTKRSSVFVLPRELVPEEDVMDEEEEYVLDLLDD